MHFKLKIGKRIIKSAITLFLIFLIYIALLFVDEMLQIDASETWKAPSNMYTPFFAGIAAIYATHRDKKSSIKQAKVRSIGTLIGGYFGMILVFLLEFIFIDIFHVDQGHYAIYALIKYSLVTIFIIPLIIVSIKLKQADSVFITCLTYLSVTVSIRNGGMPVFQFATNRVISTLIGVGVSLLVNVNLFVVRKKNKNVLFVSTLENNILSSNDDLSPYVKYKLNELYESDINMVFATTRTAIAFESIFKDINIARDMIVMNGAAKYNFIEKTYNDVYHISHKEREIIETYLKDSDINAFTYTINDNVMHAYYNKLSNPGETLYFNHRKSQNTYSFVKGVLPSDLMATLYIAIDTKEKIDEFIEKVKQTKQVDNINFIVYKYKENIEGKDYYYLRIVNNKTNKDNAIKKLSKQYQTDHLIVCVSGHTDMELVKKANLSMCLNTAPDYVKEKVDLVVNGGPDSVLKIFSKIYHSKNINKTIEMIKKH